MRMHGGVVVVCIALGLFAVSCSNDNNTSGPVREPGRITAGASGIAGQNGKYLAIFVYNYDWFPGAEEPAVGGTLTSITDEDFSYSAAAESLGVEGQPTGHAKVFDGGNYSVVFFVGPVGFAPEHFAEVRAVVDGDITVSAPAWANWQHT
jgi:hypothetical protein